MNEEQILVEVLKKKDLRDLLDAIYDNHNIPFAIVDNNDIIRYSINFNQYDFCKNFHQKHPDIQNDCQIHNSKLFQNKLNGEDLIKYDCPMGLNHYIAKLFVGNKKVGRIILGQVVEKRYHKTELKKLAKTYQFPESDYLQAANQIQVADINKVQNYFNLIQNIVDVFVKKFDKESNYSEVPDQKFKIISTTLQKVIDNTLDAVFITDFDGNYVYINKTAEQLIGYSLEEIRKLRITDLNADATSEQYTPSFKKLLVEGSISTIIRLKSKDSNIIPVEMNSVILPEGFAIGFCRDITEKFKIKEDLDKIFKFSFDLMLTLDLDSLTIDKFNDRAIDLLEYSAQELNSINIADIIHSEDKALFLSNLLQESKYNTKTNLEIRFKTKNNKVIWFEVNLHRDKPNNSLFLIAKNITDRKINEEILIENEQLFRNIFDNNQIGMVLSDSQLRFKKINKKFAEIFGYEESELLKMSFFDLTHPDYIENDLINIKKLTNNEIPFYETTKKYITKTGSEIWADVFVSVIRDSNGRFSSYLASIKDVTVEKLAEIAIAKSEARYRALIQQSPVGILILEEDKIVFANVVLAKMFGLNYPEQLYGKSILEFIHKEYKETAKNRLAKLSQAEGNSVEVLEEKFVTTRGEEIDVLVTGHSIEFHGKLATQGYIFEITRLKEAERELSKTQKLYHSLIETSQDLIWQTDENSRYTFLNKTWEKVLGYKIKDMLGKHYSEFLAPGEFDRINEKLTKELRENHKFNGFEAKLKAKNGNIKHLLFNGILIRDESDGSITIQGSAQDITQRKLYEEALKDQMQRLQDAQRIGKVGDFLLDLTNNQLFWSKQQYNNFDVSPDTFKPSLDNFFKLVHKDDREKTRNIINDIINNKKTGFYEYKVLTPKGRIKYFETNVEIIRDDKGKPLLAKGTTREITDRKKIELDLREKQFFLEQAQKVAKIGNFRFEINTGKWISSASLDDILGIDENYQRDLKGWFFIIHPEFREQVKKYVIDDTIRHNKDFIDFELKIIDQKTKKSKWIHVIGKIEFKKKKPEVIFGSIQDITERKQTETQLQNLAKLESLGVLAGGIAHNFKNILASATINIGLAKLKPENAEKYLNKIDRALEQAADLARRFQTFTTTSEPIKELIDIKDVIKQTLDLTMSGSKHKYNFSFDEDLYNIEADSKQLSEVFTNLILNALDAMPQTGKIDIIAENISILGDIKLKDGDYIKITVKDTGIGIPQEILDKIFDPFFSTKGINRGLGLSSCYFIIEQHGGKVTVKSELGKGTQFDILLPACKNKIIEKVQDSEINNGKGEKILFVDDDEFIRENFEEFGEILNYNIDCCANGEEALEKYRKAMESNNPYKVVILDLTLQGSTMQGEDIINELLKIDPKVKAIVFSGHSTKPIVARYKEYGFIERLEKPVTLNKLADLLSKVVK